MATRKKWRVGTPLKVLNHDGPYCRYCGAPAPNFGWLENVNNLSRVWLGGHHLDHIVPCHEGGGSEPENLVVCCSSCNLRKGKHGDRTPPLGPRYPFALGPPRHTTAMVHASHPFRKITPSPLWTEAVRALSEAT